MGNRKQAFRELEENFANAQAELEAVKWELAVQIDATIQKADENEALLERIVALEEVIVEQSFALFVRPSTPGHVTVGQKPGGRVVGSIDYDQAKYCGEIR
ncbi:hypothetical protein [Amycolatopsis kentuckyensis]|uniref:hypothetical protein n=1 Tax=Amycolatopsis kentuckyensis TaxID=218823 RepID=UPI000A3C7B96|nr:hypothetical protein [Amycolatopsis kentuckyensis]